MMNSVELKDFIPISVTRLACKDHCPEYINASIEKNVILFLSDSYSFILQLLNSYSTTLSNEDSAAVKIFIVVNDDPSVVSCVITIERNTNHAVKGYVRDSNPPQTPHDQGSFWKEQLELYKVMVMNITIYKNALDNDFLTAKDAFMVIFEECIYEENNKLMTDIVNKIYVNEHHPRIVGLSQKFAKLLSVEVTNVITDLEQRLRAKFVLCLKREDIFRYIGNQSGPTNEVVEYEDRKMVYRDEVKRMFDDLFNVIEFEDIEDPNTSILDKVFNDLKDLEKLALEGCLEGYFGISLFWRDFWYLTYKFPDGLPKFFYSHITTFLRRLRIVVGRIVLNIHTEEDLNSLLSVRVTKILLRFKQDESPYPENRMRYIVWTKSQNSAIVLYTILNYLKLKDNLTLSAGFLHNPEVEEKRKFLQKHVLLNKWNSEILNKFHDHKTDILIVSDEIPYETLIKHCSLLISYDAPSSFDMYLKRYNHGLAQCRYSFVLAKKGDFGKIEEDLNDYKCRRERIVNSLLRHGIDQNYIMENEKEVGKVVDEEEEEDEDAGNDGFMTDFIKELQRMYDVIHGDNYITRQAKYNVFYVDVGVKCNLPLPANYKYSAIIKGGVCEEVVEAKRNVAALAWNYINRKEIDYDSEVLNKNFMELSHPNFLNDVKKYISFDSLYYDMAVPTCFENSQLKSDEYNYVHIIHLHPKFQPTENRQKLYIENFYRSANEIAFVTGTELLMISSFPIFTNEGKIIVNIQVNAIKVKLSMEEILKLKKFHTTLFLDVLRVVPCFMTQDNSPTGYRYLYVPVKLTGTPEIDWATINDYEIFPLKKPSDEVRKNSEYMRERFLGKVVTPWYRQESSRMDFVVVDVLEEMSPYDIIPGTEHSFAEYMEDKYLVDTLVKNQPLINARSISTRLECLDYRYDQTSNRRRERHLDRDSTLIPELCIVQKFPAVYWIKAVYLPGISFRLHYNLVAKDIRNRIIRDIDLMEPQEERVVSMSIETNNTQIGDTNKWPTKNVVVSMVNKTLEQLALNEYPWKEENLPVDINRKLSKVNRKDIIAYYMFIEEPIMNRLVSPSSIYDRSPVIDEVPQLNIFHNQKRVNIELIKALEAITTENTNDAFHNGRLKKLGQSILQFVATIFLYIINPELDATDLLKFKNQLLSNEYISGCASRRLNLESYIRVQKFDPPDIMLLPGFCVPKQIEKLVDEFEINDMDLLYSCKLPYTDRKSGRISARTRISTIPIGFEDCFEQMARNGVETNLEFCNSSFFFGKQLVSDRMIANTSKALIATFCEVYGMDSSLSIVRALGIFHDSLTNDQVQKFKNHFEDYMKAKNDETNTGIYVPYRSKLENILNYQFQNSWLLLEVLTHSSFIHTEEKFISICNKKLSLLGGSILDLLFTAFVHQEFNHYKVTEMKDLIYALTSNVTYSFVSARLGLHKFLLHNSSRLSDSINKYLQRMEYPRKIVVWDVLYKTCDGESNAEENTIPIALADVFKSIIAAIYLDCGMNLSTVWDLCYKLMQEDIKYLIVNCQRNPTTWLKALDSDTEFVYGDPDTITGKFVASVNVSGGDVECCFGLGFGDSKREAKYAASKVAIAELNTRN